MQIIEERISDVHDYIISMFKKRQEWKMKNEKYLTQWYNKYIIYTKYICFDNNLMHV